MSPGLRTTFGDQVARRAAHRLPTDPYGPVVTGELRDESQVVMFPTNGERLKSIGTADGLQAFAGHIPFEAVIPFTAGLAALQGESQ